MSVDDTGEQQQQQQQQQSTFETPEFMTDWTEKQKSGNMRATVAFMPR